jgi:hypothetical protein
MLWPRHYFLPGNSISVHICSYFPALTERPYIDCNLVTVCYLFADCMRLIELANDHGEAVRNKITSILKRV